LFPDDELVGIFEDAAALPASVAGNRAHGDGCLLFGSEAELGHHGPARNFGLTWTYGRRMAGDRVPAQRVASRFALDNRDADLA